MALLQNQTVCLKDSPLNFEKSMMACYCYLHIDKITLFLSHLILSYFISPAVAGGGVEIRGLRGLHLDSGAAGSWLDLLSEDFCVTLQITATVRL